MRKVFRLIPLRQFVFILMSNCFPKYIYSGGTQGSDSARYCYAVWLRHLVLSFQNGLEAVPQRVAEFGPGDSLGIGLAALLSGSAEYTAFDSLSHANTERNQKVLHELVALFSERANIPDEQEFPDMKPLLHDYSFPVHILPENLLQNTLKKERIANIESALLAENQPEVKISYFAQWQTHNIPENSVDYIISQRVLEHIDSLAGTYHLFSKILSAGGMMSHDIDFRSHRHSKYWNGHWAFSDKYWKLICGKLPYLLNRQTYSEHVLLIQQAGLNIIYEDKYADISTPAIDRKKLSLRFSNMSDDDLQTQTAFIIAKK
ncbi:MAG: hypothetical protein FWG20_00210 [Candidatus Cloacimonetes bacterium]|nr:hypothetical protein [Candidatus Cloacimonadota bacterium]